MPKRVAVVVVALCALAATAPAGAAAAKPAGKVEIHTISTRADLVTGGDVLVAVDVENGADPAKVGIRRNGEPVTGAFSPSANDPNRLVGLVDGLANGDNTISAYGKEIRKPARLDVYNSPITGPVFSGPWQTPFFCRTEAAGLGPATDGNCSAPTQVSWYYRTNTGKFAPLANPKRPLPADGVQTTTRDGKKVDYVVRLESGVVDRSVYRYAILAPGGVPAAGWNGRLVFSFGGGCGAGYQQGTRGVNTALTNAELSQGYATLTGSLNVLGTACNDVLSAEAAQMLKEHVIEELGRAPVWTMGQGGSGGSVQQQLIAQNYPGILDGIMPGASFPDGAGPDYPDCRLLNAYFATPAGAALSDAQRRAITGMVQPNGCLALGAGADVVNASEGCDEKVVPPAQIFDPVTNPDGIRCTVWDSMVNIYGRDASTGYARRTLDNVGVQYGLGALKDGAISVDQFLDLNQGIGGYDDNGELQPQRTVADPKALAIAYSSGRVNRTDGGYTDVPVLDIRNYQDNDVNVHQYVNTYRTRARLDAEHGNHANQVMWRAIGGPSVGAMGTTALSTLADWMDAIAADGSARTQAQKVVADKPASAVDACWINGVRHDGVAKIGADNICENTYPPHSLPVNVAGKPLDSVAIKCQLKPIDYADYGVSFSPAQKTRLQGIFPNGVCDWTKPGVEQQDLEGTWQEFGPTRNPQTRARTVRLSAKRVGPGKVSMTARLSPCPATSWQELSFEKKRKKSQGGGWRSFATAPATGKDCSATARLKAGKKQVRLRASSAAVYGYAAARSQAKKR